MARVLVACEFSGIVRDAFVAHGADAWSCDLLETEQPGQHIIGDVRDHLNGWDLIVAHPPCTHLASSGARWWSEKERQQSEAIAFVLELWNAPCGMVAIENPVGKLSTAWRKPDQIVQPWWFGDGAVKTTCLWLRGLPLLMKTDVSSGRDQQCWKMSPSADRWKNRSRTYRGFAVAMAKQWMDHLTNTPRGGAAHRKSRCGDPADSRSSPFPEAGPPRTLIHMNRGGHDD